MNVKWGKEMYRDVEVDTDDKPLVFKAQLYALTGVLPDRQKVMFQGATLKDGDWNDFKIHDVCINPEIRIEHVARSLLTSIIVIKIFL